MTPHRAALPLSLLVAVCGVSTGFAQSNRDALAAAVKERLARFEKQSSEPSRSIATRDFCCAAFFSLFEGEDGQTAQKFLNAAFATQDMNPGSKTFGELKWATGDAEITDRNAVEFATQPIGPMLLSFGDRLPARFQEDFHPHLIAAVAGLRNHRVSVSYTNIFLMKSVSLLLMGQAMKDESAVRDGRRMLDEWIAYTRKTGVHEFDSPTYYATDLDSLVEGFRYAASAADRGKFAAALHLLWTDIAANFFAPGGRIGGPYSRDYEFLDGVGILTVWLGDAGWVSPDPKLFSGFDWVFLLDNARPGGYWPPADVAALVVSGPRMVISNWDELPGHLRWNWQGQHVSLGCTSGNYGPQDKLFVAMLPGPLHQPQISLVVDAYDAPYGLRREPDRSGHMKPVHLPPHLACVQSDGTALLSLDIDPSQMPPAAPGGLTTNFILPADATIAVNGRDAALNSPTTVTAPAGAIITAAAGGSTIAIRIIRVEALDQKEPTIVLESDADGLSHHAVRLKITNLAAGQHSAAHHVREAFLVCAADCDPAKLLERMKHADIISRVAADDWTIAAVLPPLSLAVKRSASKPEQIDLQSINGVPVVPMTLGVNGKDLAGPIWAELDAPERP
jgi:hypothetical protein